ncbi:MAG: putative sulfate exporter family transporter [Myxococcales bacterium]|nr:putative sulfate exporter family transporter [Myxococcales bacterium]HIL81068.1 putative sulfate exporter family transporter [Myxococcales bacterium]
MDRVQPAAGLSDPYKNPELFRWLDSLEGVPDWLGPAETDAERAGWSDWQRRGNHIFALVGTMVPGLVLAFTIAMAGRVLANLPNSAFGFENTPLSPILVSIILGLFIRNAIGLPTVYEAGLQLALKKVLRVGVALLGIRLSLAATGAIGLVALPIVTVCIATALFFVTRVGAAIGLPPRLATLIAVGTAICGNSAIIAMAPVIDATDDEVSYAVGCITIFGLAALMFYPYLGHLIFDGDATLIGLFMGTAIHDTAQVAGAGMVYLAQYGSAEVLDAATVTKLQRNMFMLAVIPLMAFYSNRSRATGSIRSQIRAALPMFVFGFLAMSLLRTLGDMGEHPFGIMSPETWSMLISWATKTATLCLAVAMSAVGLGTSFTKLRGLGVRPLLVGLFAAALVGCVSYVLVSVAAPYTAGIGG